MTTTLKLIQPIRDHAGPVTELVFREPKYADLIRLGEPSSYARGEGGIIFVAENDSVVRGYLEALLVKPVDPALLDQLSLADGLAAKDIVHGFFGTAREAVSASRLTSSSST